MKIDPLCPDCELPSCPGFGCIARIHLGDRVTQSRGGYPLRPNPALVLVWPTDPCRKCGGVSFSSHFDKRRGFAVRACRACRLKRRRGYQEKARSEHPALRRTA